MILDATALALAICVTIGRGYFALGRDGLLPSVFAKTSRHNTPWVGNLMVVVGGVGLILVGLYSHTIDRFMPIAGSQTSPPSSWLGHGRVVRGRARLPDPGGGGDRPAGARRTALWWQYLVVLVAVATPVLGLLRRAQPGSARHPNLNWLALYWALGVVVMAVVWFGAVRIMRPEQVANAASHAAQHHGVAPLDENLDFTPAPPDTTI